MEPPIPPVMLDVNRRSAGDFAELAQVIRQAGCTSRSSADGGPTTRSGAVARFGAVRP
jgi:hypothetical protein